jgi:YD repeat-containing protein
LGRVRINLDPNFGKWEYRYNDLGQVVETVSPTGNTAAYSYDKAGRLLEEKYNGATEAQYFYDVYPGDAVLGLSNNFEWEGYPAYGITIGRMVAVKDRTGVSIAAADRGTRSESWRQIEPSDRIYHFETRVNWAGELIWSENPDGERSTVEYYEDGVFKSSYFKGKKIVDDVRANMFGQVETIKYADSAKTESWTGYNPVTHQAMSTVVQQQNRVYQQNGPSSKATLMAFGYEYDAVGKLIGIADWRGRDENATTRLGLNIPHPSTYASNLRGYHQSAYPSYFDKSMAGPAQWNSSDMVTGTMSGWPVGAAPSDAKFEYDTLYQLVSEDREYITANGADSQLDDDYQTVQERVRTLDWKFDATGAMTEWLDGEDSAGNIPSNNLGRALGRIENGYQLNLKADISGACMNDLADSDNVEVNSDCLKPDALYFATNADEVNDPSDPTHGRGTCIWVDYDAAGRMTKQTVRTGCKDCEYEDRTNTDPNFWA